MASCNVRKNSVEYLKKQQVIDNNMFVTNNTFKLYNTSLTNTAKIKYGIKPKEGELLFIEKSIGEGKSKIFLNEPLFTQLQTNHDAYYKAKRDSFERDERFFMGDTALYEQEQRESLFFQTVAGQDFTNQLQDKLLNFISGLGIKTVFNADEMLNSKEFKTNPLAAFDVLQKFMAFASGQEKMIPQQVAAAAYTFLGRKSSLSKALWKYIKEWDGYEKWYGIYSKNFDRQDETGYEDDEYMADESFNPFAHKMAIIKFLEESFIKVASGETPTIKTENEDVDANYFLKRGYLNDKQKDISVLETIFRKVYNWFVRNVLRNEAFKKYDKNSLTQLGLDIAEDVLKNDYKKFIRGIQE